MIIELREQETFRPIKLDITLESQEEVNELFELISQSDTDTLNTLHNALRSFVKTNK